MRRILALTVLVGTIALGGSPAFGQTQFADLVVKNAKVTTQSHLQPSAAALAVRDGRFAKVGSIGDITPLIGPKTQVIDADGRRIVPGLIDSHSHFLRSGLTYTRELRWDGVPTLKQALAMLSEQAKRTPEGEWVRVIGGWTPWQFKEQRLPTVAEINEAAPNTPVYIQYFYSVGLVNRVAMARLGINQQSEDPKGGRFVRDSSGNPTGLMIADPHPGIFYGKIAALPNAAPDVEANSTMHMFFELARWGITGVIDAGGGGFRFPEHYSTAQKLAASGKLPIRASFFLFAQRPGKEAEDFSNWTNKYTAGWNFDPVKPNGFQLGGGGEYILWDAADFENFRSPRPDLPAGMEERLELVLKTLIKKRWFFRIHATYDESISRILDVIEAVNKETPLNGLRWSIEHGETISEKSVLRIRALGGGLAIQNRMIFLGDDFVLRYGAEKAKATPPLRTILDSGIPVGMGTDATRGSTFNPWISLHYLVTGETASGRKLYDADNLMTRAEALHVHTIGSAWFSGEEDIKGRIVPGQLADFAILNKDYFEVPVNEIKTIKSDVTVVGGNVVYGAGPFKALSPELPAILPEWSPLKHYGAYWSDR
ncbi:amidohydrolase [Enterovibrio baiacu]|uniref:amidohydrolase n=1 Tax=Enterovibrio baiacu TaxID=2491023 RepID=UPI001010CD0D|nr:amidohydrolase [Enterovibrio baiacu]MBE1275564.1 amidohydrolase [Enterovibrio baiacu]